MPRSTRRVFVILFAAALFVAAAGAARAETVITELNEWTETEVSGVGAVTPTYSVTLPEQGYLLVTDAFCAGTRFSTTINGHDEGQTSQPIPFNCDVWTSDPDEALTRSEWSHGAYPLPAGTSKFVFKGTVAPMSAGFFFKVGPGVYIDRALAVRSGLKVITSKGKVSTRAEAIEACTSAGMALADATAANWAAVVNAVRLSSALSITASSSDAVVIGTWNGDSYGGSNLQLAVRADATGTITNAGITLLTAPRYPLCQPPKETPLPGTPAATQHSGNLAVVGPAGKVQFLTSMCRSLGADYAPVVLSGARPDEFKTASTLAFNAAGANAQVWIGGWEELSNKPLALATGSAAGAGSVVEPEDRNSSKLYLCKKKI
ncbi:hypothetical protein GGF31_006489 [Allomyces arbusculus]|nr:hypothetical protein GGF31_006489 [Allomyces arbusculus]